MDQLAPDHFSSAAAEEAILWLEKYQAALNGHRNRLAFEKDALVDSLKVVYGGLEAYLGLKRSFHNEQLAQLVLNRTNLHKVVKQNGMLLRKMDPVYMYPLKKNGRAHFFASVKQIGNNHMSTLVFNMLVIWIMSVILYFLLRYSVLQKTIEFLGDLKRKV